MAEADTTLLQKGILTAELVTCQRDDTTAELLQASTRYFPPISPDTYGPMVPK